MKTAFIILLMIFLHIIDDYRLQGILSNMKQKEWWRKLTDNPLYKYDYIWALIMHSFSWTFMVTLPIMYLLNWTLTFEFIVIFIIQMAIHGITDDLKANKHRINLWTDQLIHMAQLVWLIIEFVI